MATNKVTIVICYQTGTAPMLETCLNAIKRHTRYANFSVLVVSREFDIEGAEAVQRHDFAYMVPVDIGVAPSVSSRVHGMMLDHVCASLSSELILTLDSDCFPVAGGWLTGLVEIMSEGAEVTGILHPWSPPPDDMKQTLLEWRIRSQHCWNVTHVACQLVRRLFLVEHNLKYNDGDDTGLTIPMKALSLGRRVGGYKVTRCPKAEVGRDEVPMNPEFNRYVCLVFGDKVYHHGGYTRTTTFGDEGMMHRSFGWAMKRVVDEHSADFILDDRLSYQFRLDREEEVAAEKMQRLFGLKSQRMEG